MKHRDARTAFDASAEEWRQIPGMRYEASSLGRIRSLQPHTFGRILKQRRRPKGYLEVHVSVDGASKNRRVHRLVMMAFVGPDSREVDHKDRNPTNNRLENLEYVTPEENWARRSGGLPYSMCPWNPVRWAEAKPERDRRRAWAEEHARATAAWREAFMHAWEARQRRHLLPKGQRGLAARELVAATIELNRIRAASPLAWLARMTRDPAKVLGMLRRRALFAPSDRELLDAASQTVYDAAGATPRNPCRCGPPSRRRPDLDGNATVVARPPLLGSV